MTIAFAAQAVRGRRRRRLCNLPAMAQPSANRMLILEFNELCPRLLAPFMDEGVLPNFSRLYNASDVYTTTTSDEHLEPWVQWVNFHHGLPESRHGVHD